MQKDLKELREEVKRFGYEVFCRRNTMYAINLAKPEVDVFTCLDNGKWRYSTIAHELFLTQKSLRSKGVVRIAEMTKDEVLDYLYNSIIRIRRLVIKAKLF